MSQRRLIIEGNLGGVIVGVNKVADIISNRNTIGYSMLHPDFQWRYVTKRDHRVCPICEPLDGKIFTGSQLRSMFPMVTYLGNYIAHPRTHDNPEARHMFPREGEEFECGCRLRLLKPAESFEHILHKEKMGVKLGD